MEPFIQGWGLTIALCAFIVLVAFGGWWHVYRELSWVRALTDHLGFELVADEAGSGKPPSSLDVQQIRDESHAVLTAKSCLLLHKIHHIEQRLCIFCSF
jgi:hypothetical protein